LIRMTVGETIDGGIEATGDALESTGDAISGGASYVAGGVSDGVGAVADGVSDAGEGCCDGCMMCCSNPRRAIRLIINGMCAPCGLRARHVLPCFFGGARERKRNRRHGRGGGDDDDDDCECCCCPSPPELPETNITGAMSDAAESVGDATGMNRE